MIDWIEIGLGGLALVCMVIGGILWFVANIIDWSEDE